MQVRLLALAASTFLIAGGSNADVLNDRAGNLIALSPSFFREELIENLNNPVYMQSRTDLFQKWSQRSFERDGQKIAAGEHGISFSGPLHIEYVYYSKDSRRVSYGTIIAVLQICDTLGTESVSYSQTLKAIQLRYPQSGKIGNIYGASFQINQSERTDMSVSHFSSLPDNVQCIGVVSYTADASYP